MMLANHPAMHWGEMQVNTSERDTDNPPKDTVQAANSKNKGGGFTTCHCTHRSMPKTQIKSAQMLWQVLTRVITLLDEDTLGFVY